MTNFPERRKQMMEKGNKFQNMENESLKCQDKETA